ncbi:MAG: hypothetical protein ACD_20C00150G0008 [uncultured bacterium]|nr:MAG: hypothetical protein ACD_20C00150G0008 [uncultured bacterium]HBH18463.1 hypothetical protein [Cyanobacteria bacterium UBA9579]
MEKKTLAEFVSSRREEIGLSQKGLANKSNLDLSIIESVESGQELFLATSIRQKLAKGLKIESKAIKSLEKHPKTNKADPSPDYIEELKLRILDGQLSGNACPVCKSELVCRVAEMLDLHDNPVKHPKARCSKCPFLLR